MATGDYCTPDELKRELWPDDLVPDGANDVALQEIIGAVSREIDYYTGTCFYAPASDTRYFTADNSRQCWIDPCTTVTSVATDDESDLTFSTSWTLTTDYRLWPYNANAYRGLPATRIDRSPLGNYSFPRGGGAVKVVGVFCYNASASPAATLDDIKRVVYLKCLRMNKRSDSPFGMLSVGEAGGVAIIPGLDPDEKRILDNYRVNYYG